MAKRFKKMEGLVEVLKGLLENKVVDGVIVPQVSEGRFTQNMITKPELMRDVQPFAPVFNVSTARLISRWVATDKRIGVVLKPCELRAVIELIKLKQIDKEKVLLIGTDCYGCFTLDVFTKNEGKITPHPTADEMAKAGKKMGERTTCTFCAHHLPTEADIVLGRLEKEYFVGSASERGLEALKDAELKEEALTNWLEAGASLDKNGTAHKQKEFKKLSEKLKDPKGLEEIFANCIGCKNCRLVCPVCYCKECFFERPLNNPSADEMLMLANAKDGLKLPFDVLYFHLVRLNHMSISCVGCGMCEDACPKDIPVSLIFECIGDEVQKAFEYEAGRSVKEPIPMTIFKEDDEEPYKK